MWNASYTNGAHPLTVHMQIGGTVTIHNRHTDASISRESDQATTS
jgi:hypothetical protein